MPTSRSAHDVAVSEDGISDESYSEIGNHFNSAGITAVLKWLQNSDVIFYYFSPLVV
jgi:hypothetical protein